MNDDEVASLVFEFYNFLVIKVTALKFKLNLMAKVVFNASELFADVKISQYYTRTSYAVYTYFFTENYSFRYSQCIVIFFAHRYKYSDLF